MLSKQKELEKLNLPDLMFKYRDWKNDYHKTVITERNVYMASPSTFEDKLDCKIPIRYDLLTEKDIFDKYLHHSKIDNPNWNRKRHREHAREWTKKSLLNNKEYLKEFQETYFEAYFERIGVLSLTADPENENMWDKYSNNQTGFCVGFDTLKMFKSLGGGGNVNYCDKLPIIYPEPKQSFEEQHFLQIYSKEKKWEYEKEYRTYIFKLQPLTENQRLIKIPPEAYNHIILGKRMSIEDKEEIRKSIPEELKNITILEL